ncbi:MAG: SRPBCC domain-containing protein [Saprospiraceae bacterium]|jgi:PhnB protein|nr:SRPBCC domain-containing protein [Saprospiraceae bacterium]MBK8778824.1 SRPBCC domain-containing protein [Saprospiraceae bacterium]
MIQQEENTADRELRISRLLSAPIELVWDVWTQPAHIAQWWGPNGFTNTIQDMEVQAGGIWNLTMHGPDGTDYNNKSIFSEVIHHQKLVYKHVSVPPFIATIQFEAQGQNTLLNWHMLFESRDQFIQVVKTFKADEGLKQNVEKLTAYLARQLPNVRTNIRSGRFQLVRTFNAPISMVFEAFENAAAMADWWGPAGMAITVKKLDFRPGGSFHYKMEGPVNTMWGLFKYVTIQKPNKIEFVNSFSDESGNVCKAPFDIDFPEEIFNQISLEEHQGVTTLTLTGGPRQATDAQLATYDAMHESMQQGFGGTFNQLETYLASQIKLRYQLKNNIMSRVSTYLNFPGNTEEAFLFYRSVFGGEFSGGGIQRFGDIPVDTEHPSLSDEDKKLILHIELPILGGHILMATDAPASMGFTVTTGNNMHINLEPATREETKKLFEALSAEGNISMPLQEMFWGGYFGSCIDKYGINWMFNCAEKV